MVPYKAKIEKEDDDPLYVIRGFGVGTVFDLSQTDGKPLPGVVWRKGEYCTLRPCDRPQGAEAAFFDALIRSPGVIAGQVDMVPVYRRDVRE